jgi:hypothetical protein
MAKERKEERLKLKEAQIREKDEIRINQEKGKIKTDTETSWLDVWLVGWLVVEGGRERPSPGHVSRDKQKKKIDIA